MTFISSLPIGLQAILKDSILVENKAGRVGDYIAQFENLDGEQYFLKYGVGYAAEELKLEEAKIKVIGLKNIIVPRVIFYSEEKGGVFLMISGIKGKPAHEISKTIGKEKTTEIVGNALAELHKMSIFNIPFINTLQNELLEIQQFIDQGLISTNNFLLDNKISPKEAFNYLYEKKNIFTEDVFTHGDYCLPNLIVDENLNCGYIDWAKAGIADRHRDFSAMEGSIKRNFGVEYIDLFYSSYGLDRKNVSDEKIKYYQLIDQFHYNKI